MQTATKNPLPDLDQLIGEVLVTLAEATELASECSTDDSKLTLLADGLAELAESVRIAAGQDASKAQRVSHPAALPAYRALQNVADLLGGYDGAAWRQAVLSRIAVELDDGGKLTTADFVAILGDIAKEVRRGK